MKESISLLLPTLEAMLFVRSEPLLVAQVQEALLQMGQAWEKPDIEEAFRLLLEKWDRLSSQSSFGFELVCVAGGFLFRTKPEQASFLQHLFQEKPQKLSASQLEVLSIVAYRQPLTRIEVEQIRGVDCSAALRKLLSLKLIKILGKSEGLGRPLLYGTTKQFLELFGLNSLRDLPSLKDYKELNKEENQIPQDTEAQVEMKDLFLSSTLMSEQTQKVGEQALKSLEQALGIVSSANEQIQEQESEG